MAVSPYALRPDITLASTKDFSDSIQYAENVLTQNAITASATHTQAGATVIYNHYARVTSAGGNDTVVLGFGAGPGRRFVIINDSGAIVNLYPKSGHKLNDANIDAAVTLADNTISTYYCSVKGLWFGGPVTLATI